MEKWNCYTTSPVDWGWNFQRDFKQLVVKLAIDDAENAFDIFRSSFCQELLDDFEYAKAAALDKGWEGDFAEGPKVLGIPNSDGSFSNMFVWKQKNNGTTFFITSLELPWME